MRDPQMHRQQIALGYGIGRRGLLNTPDSNFIGK